MTDFDRGRIGGGDEDRLPWLEPVEDEQPVGGVNAGKLIAAVIVCLLALGLIVGGIFWLRDRASGGEVAGGNGDLITAPPGDYKVPPAQPGGMTVPGEGDATYAASQGVPVDAAIDISKQPEAPIAAGRAPAAAPAPAPVAAAPATSAPRPAEVKGTAPPAPKPVEVAKAPEPAKSAGAGPGVQLGAFSSEAKAQAAWSGLTGRFPALKSLSHSVSLAEVGGKKLYRLRASAGSGTKASAMCKALTSAKEPCSVVG